LTLRSYYSPAERRRKKFERRGLTARSKGNARELFTAYGRAFVDTFLFLKTQQRRLYMGDYVWGSHIAFAGHAKTIIFPEQFSQDRNAINILETMTAGQAAAPALRATPPREKNFAETPSGLPACYACAP